MITPSTLNRLEFPKILQVVAKYARSEATTAVILATAPLRNPSEIGLHWRRIEEIRALLRQRIELRISRFSDIRPLLEQVRPDGAILTPLGLLEFIPVLNSLAELARQFAPRDDIPALQLLDPLPIAFSDILEPLSATLDAEGTILDSASRELAEIRKAKRVLAARVRRKLEEIVRKHETAIFLQDDFITIRSGRWVIPVRMDSKGMVPGVVHDVSSSGETAFMEPLEIIPFVNELENLSAEEKAEEIRILRRISGWIREDADRIAACFTTLVELDRLDCLAHFAERYNLAVPELNREGKLRLLSARHPLLLVMQGDDPQGRPIVPLDLELNSAQVLVISGPNAGGKTIALKTVGLISAMALSGMPVPASPSSTLPLLDSLLVDIGDEQSIEQSLSTFSAHIAAISRILEQAGPRSLVLLDELGTGTEPLQGAAIGCAVLQELQERGAVVLTTTHLTEIVGFVQQKPGMQNAGMEFDSATWTPLYRLVMGEPGQSHALETARRYGLPESVLTTARALLGDTGTAFAGLIDELRRKRDALHAELTAQKQQRQLLEDQASDLAQQRDRLVQLRQETIDKARADARDLITAARREMNQLLEQFKQDRRKETAETFRQKTEELEASFAPAGQQAPAADLLKAGSVVQVRSLGRDATVVSVDQSRNKVRVRAGSIELEVPLHGLSVIQGQEARKQGQGSRGKGQGNAFALAGPWPPDPGPSEVHLIGRRVEEALTELEGFIDQAVLAGQREVRIVHGIGTGTLQRAVREFLGRHPQVNSFRSGEPHEGRDGATVVTLEP
jgi:DNA mismatch repair protein MutS2